MSERISPPLHSPVRSECPYPLPLRCGAILGMGGRERKKVSLAIGRRDGVSCHPRAPGRPAAGRPWGKRDGSIWPLSQGKNGSPWSNQSSHSTELEFVGLVELEPPELRH